MVNIVNQQPPCVFENKQFNSKKKKFDTTTESFLIQKKIDEQKRLHRIKTKENKAKIKINR